MTDDGERVVSQLFTSADVAWMFQVDVSTVGRWVRLGRVAGIRTPGGHLRFRPAEIDRLLADLGE